ncbi:MAG: DNA translocase FtsK [Christensenellaceae bacterium]
MFKGMYEGKTFGGIVNDSYVPQQKRYSGKENDVDPIRITALRYVVSVGQVSISMIQRRFGVGYNHAGRIIEWMEQMGYVSAFDGAKTRKVLITKEELIEKYGDETEE